MIIYAETSALVPLIKAEESSHTLRDYFEGLRNEGHLLLTGRLTETELRRTAHRFGIPQGLASDVLEALVVEDHTPSHFKLAGTIGAPNLRSLDALHVATALHAGCAALITRDARVAEASESMGIPTLDFTRPAIVGRECP